MVQLHIQQFCHIIYASAFCVLRNIPSFDLQWSWNADTHPRMSENAIIYRSGDIEKSGDFIITYIKLDH
jgi:hypothetical protein